MGTWHLVRHGETEWNRTGRMQGHTGVPLSAEGRRQATLLAARLRSVEFSAVYSSDLPRAAETARIIADGREPCSHNRHRPSRVLLRRVGRADAGGSRDRAIRARSPSGSRPGGTWDSPRPAARAPSMRSGEYAGFVSASRNATTVRKTCWSWRMAAPCAPLRSACWTWPTPTSGSSTSTTPRSRSSTITTAAGCLSHGTTRVTFRTLTPRRPREPASDPGAGRHPRRQEPLRPGVGGRERPSLVRRDGRGRRRGNGRSHRGAPGRASDQLGDAGRTP